VRNSKEEEGFSKVFRTVPEQRLANTPAHKPSQ